MKIEIDRELLVQALDYIDNGPYYNKPLVDALREALDKSHQELLLTPSQIIHSDACVENKVTIYEEVSPSVQRSSSACLDCHMWSDQVDRAHASLPASSF